MHAFSKTQRRACRLFIVQASKCYFIDTGREGQFANLLSYYELVLVVRARTRVACTYAHVKGEADGTRAGHWAGHAPR